MSDIFEEARRWAAADPDPETSAALLDAVADGDTALVSELMGAPLEFGTAGIRGEVGPGRSRMNRAVVIRTSRGLADFLIDRRGGPPKAPIVLGFDARPTSRRFAEDAAGVFAAAGIGVRYFAEVTPTPIIAFAAKHLDAEAAVVVTASHNPPRDNGYKVYDSNAAQIIPPTDTAISEAIENVGAAKSVPRVEDAFEVAHDLITPLSGAILDAYWAEVQESRPTPPDGTISIVYTPLHGVGGKTFLEIMSRAGHDRITPVAAQIEPDGTFPTVAFPNPEEPGALDLALETGVAADADLVIANDPDADRLAAATPADGEWRLFTGNEVGVMLGSYLLERWESETTPITANSIVSSPMLEAIAHEHGALHLTTLTGFKWISNAALAMEEQGRGRFLFGYEEALGYTVGRTVRDKDGISAALILADIAAMEEAAGRTLRDNLADLWRRYGIWVSTQKSIVRRGESGQQEILSVCSTIASEPPASLGRHQVTGLVDYRTGADERPPWLGEQPLVELTLEDWGRVLIRPSGTEPKLKIYVDLHMPAEGEDLYEERAALVRAADNLGDELEDMASSIIAS